MGERYPQLLRLPGSEPARWWRQVFGLLVAVGALVVAGAVVVLAVGGVAALAGASDPFDTALTSADRPAGLLATNLLIALLAPAALLAVRVGHRRPLGLLVSVTGRLRCGLLLRLLPLSVGLVAVFLVAGIALPPAGVGSVRAPSAGAAVALAGVILLTTPLQAAGEELAFRGYLTQLVASWFRRPQVGTAVAAGATATLFALAHGAQDPALFTDRLAFGLTASWLAWRTGGLEAPIAFHAGNNLVSLGFGAATGTLDDALSSTTLDWRYAALDLLMMLLFALVVDRLARRWRVAALSAPTSVGYPGQRLDRPGRDPSPGATGHWGMG